MAGIKAKRQRAVPFHLVGNGIETKQKIGEKKLALTRKGAGKVGNVVPGHSSSPTTHVRGTEAPAKSLAPTTVRCTAHLAQGTQPYPPTCT